MDNSAKKKAAVSAVAAVTAASVLVGGAFTSPADVLDDGLDAHVLTVDMDMDSQTDAGDDGSSEGEEEQDKKLSSSVRRLINQAPAPLRACVALPLWLVGTLLIELGATLWGTLLSPVAAAVVGWLAISVLALLVFLLAAKTVAPDLPIKKILNKRTVPGIVLLCLCFGALDCVLPLFVEGYDKFSELVKAIGSCLCAAVPVCFFLRWNKRRIKKQEQESTEPELSYEEREKAARLLIEELADSVSRPRY